MAGGTRFVAFGEQYAGALHLRLFFKLFHRMNAPSMGNDFAAYFRASQLINA